MLEILIWWELRTFQNIMLLSASLLLIIFMSKRHKKIPDLCPAYKKGWTMTILTGVQWYFIVICISNN